jgi:amidohydrolase
MGDQLTDKIKSLSEALAPRMTEIRRQLHRFPELSGKEIVTTDRIRTWLKEEGITEQHLDIPTGVVGIVLGNSKELAETPTIAIRADIDALPVEEQTGLPFASEVKGIMHACGHDFNAAALIGAGIILSRIREELPGNVKLFFQPAEENLSGARMLIGAGAMDNQRVSTVIAGHTTPDIPVGQIGLRPGPVMASADAFRITVEGMGGHAAMPHHTVDPIVASAAIVSALQTVVSRNIDPVDTAVLSIGSFHAGSAPNIIPAETRMEGTIRTFEHSVRNRCLEQLERISTGVASAMGAKACIESLGGIPAVINNPELTRLIAESAAKIIGPANVVTEPKPLMGSEDFSLYGERVPVCYAWIGCGKPGAENRLWRHHHPRYDVAEEVLPVAAAFFARAAIDCLINAGKRP